MVHIVAVSCAGAGARQGAGDLGNGVCNVSHWTRSFRDSAAATEREQSSSELY